jgi:hypothetical protein
VVASLAGIRINDLGLARQVCSDLLDNVNLLLGGAIKVAAENSESLDENRVWVAFHGVEGFHSWQVATPLVNLRDHNSNVNHVECSFAREREVHLFVLGDGRRAQVVTSSLFETLSDGRTTNKDVIFFQDILE